MTDQCTVLIVDDNTEDCTTYRRYLTQDRGEEVYGVVVAHTGHEALRLFEEKVPDCVLLYHMMPDMDGLKVLASLRDSEGKVTCPVLMLTGSANPWVAVKAIKGGAEDYLIKEDVTSETLRCAIANAIEKRASQQMLEESHAQFEAAFTDAAIGMALVAPDGRWLRVNPAFTSLLVQFHLRSCGQILFRVNYRA
ncbi:MAG: response regulator [Chthonomonadaceae bacterium]|nr:response regulator [Chthonomonadaceae bacterium]